MAVGMAVAPDDPRNAPGREPVKKMVQAFMQRFEAEHGSTLCRDLLGCDLGSEGGYAQAREQNLFKTVCPAYVKSATDILHELMED